MLVLDTNLTDPNAFMLRSDMACPLLATAAMTSDISFFGTPTVEVLPPKIDTYRDSCDSLQEM